MKIYYFYITTNPSRTVLYLGMTNDLKRRLEEHFQSSGRPDTFAGRYYCFRLLYYETYASALEAIDRETQVKKWSRTKKEELIRSMNPEFYFLNSHFQ